MAEKTLETYIAERESEFQKESEKLEKRKKRFKIKQIIFIVLFCIILAVSFVIDRYINDSIYNEFNSIKISDTEKMNKLASSLSAVKYPEFFDKFEDGYLGNKSINSLNYGLIAENQYGYTSINESGDTIFHRNGKEYIIATESISQINIGKDLVMFRGADKKLYSCKYDGSDKKVIVNEKVGSVILAGDNLYYVNFDKSNNLYKYKLKEKKSEVVIDANIKNFAIIADYILYMDYSNNLILQNLDTNIRSWTNTNIVKFYFNGDIYVQNNDKIIKFSLNNHYPKNVATGINEFLGVDENNIYYTVKSKLYSQTIDGGEKKELPYEFDYYKGVYSSNSKITALGGVKE